MRSHLTHTAVLVHSVDRVAEFFAKKGFRLNAPEVFENEGTREIYIGDLDKDSSKILLVEPHGDGPYRRALHKRGPGLHHLGIDVENLVEYCTMLGRVGWLLHSFSLISATKYQIVYLVRPGVPLMLEVRENGTTQRSPALLHGLTLARLTKHKPMIRAMGLENVRIYLATSGGVVFKTSKGRFSLKEVLARDKRGK